MFGLYTWISEALNYNSLANTKFSDTTTVSGKAHLVKAETRSVRNYGLRESITFNIHFSNIIKENNYKTFLFKYNDFMPKYALLKNAVQDGAYIKVRVKKNEISSLSPNKALGIWQISKDDITIISFEEILNYHNLNNSADKLFGRIFFIVFAIIVFIVVCIFYFPSGNNLFLF